MKLNNFFWQKLLLFVFLQIISNSTPFAQNFASKNLESALFLTSNFNATMTNLSPQSNAILSLLQVFPTTYQIRLTEQISCSINAGSDQTICSGTNVTLIGTSPTTGTWTALSTNPTGVSLGSTSNGVAIASFIENTSTQTFNFIYTDGSCSDTVMITVNAVPNVAAISGNASAMVNDNVTFTTTTALGVWSSSNTTVATINTSGVITAKQNGTTTISYTVTHANGCSKSVQKTFTIFPSTKS